MALEIMWANTHKYKIKQVFPQVWIKDDSGNWELYL